MPRGQTEERKTGGTEFQHTADITHQLKGIDFPANKNDLIRQAKRNHAPQDILDELQNVEDREYGNIADVMKAYGTRH